MYLLSSLFQKKIWYAYLLIIYLQCFNCFSRQKPDFRSVDFFESMKTHSNLFNSEYAIKNPRAITFKALYDEFIVNHFEYCLSPRIPKIIHQIWLGSNLPEQYRVWQQTWVNHHPDWQYILWTDADIEKLGLVNKQLYNACKSYGAKSDIARYEILYRYGGLYVDCDLECLKPFDIFHHGCDFYASCDNSENGAIIRMTNCLIGVQPGHPIIKMCIEKIKQSPIRPLIAQEEVIATTGPGLLTECFFASSCEWSGPCVVFPVTYFIPFPWNSRFIDATSNDVRLKRWIKPESYAIHFWHGSWTNSTRSFKVK